jgi:hypothetical protein
MRREEAEELLTPLPKTLATSATLFVPSKMSRTHVHFASQWAIRAFYRGARDQYGTLEKHGRVSQPAGSG